MRRSKVTKPGPSSVLRPRFPGRSESGLPSRFASEPAKTLKRRPDWAVHRELILKPARPGTVCGIWLTKASVNRWGTLWRDTARCVEMLGPSGKSARFATESELLMVLENV